MKLFIKTETGVLVEASEEQMKDLKYILYTADGNLFRAAQAPAILPGADGGSDTIKALTGLVTELVGGASALKSAQDKINEQFAVIQASQSKAFPIGFGMPASEGQEKEMDAMLFKGLDLSRQGKKLMERQLKFANHQLTEEKREMLAKYFLLFLKAGFAGDVMAKIAFTQRYGDVDSHTKTAIGDSGNTFPVPDVVMEEILHFARESSVILRKASVVDMTSERQSYPLETGSVTVSWGNTTGNSDPTVSEVELLAEELSAYSVVKNMTLADSKSDIVSWLAGNMAEALGQELDNSAFNGDGTSTYGYCSGILSAAAGYSVTMGAGSTAFSQIVGDVLSEMISKLDGLRKQGGEFFMNGAILHFIRTLKDSNGRPIFYETYGSPAPPTIFGYPFTEVMKMTGTSASNTAFVAFGNLKYFMSGRRNGVTALQVDPFGLWTTNRTRYKIYNRWGQKIGLANGFVRLLTHS